MDTWSAFMMGQVNRGKELMVFDWAKAAHILRENGADYAEAGLAGDWSYTGGAILEDGKPVEEPYTYLASTWATPQLYLGQGVYVDCYLMQSETPGWDSSTCWPDEALSIFRGEAEYEEPRPEEVAETKQLEDKAEEVVSGVGEVVYEMREVKDVDGEDDNGSGRGEDGAGEEGPEESAT